MLFAIHLSNVSVDCKIDRCIMDPAGKLGAAGSRTWSVSLTLHRVQLGLLTLVVSGFSLISRCTPPQPVESQNSRSNPSWANLSRSNQRQVARPNVQTFLLRARNRLFELVETDIGILPILRYLQKILQCRRV